MALPMGFVDADDRLLDLDEAVTLRCNIQAFQTRDDELGCGVYTIVAADLVKDLRTQFGVQK